MKPFCFPIIKKVVINNFSLYSKQNVIEINIDKSVFCLAGANGLGKSTFITILNYALTGIVRNPQRTFSAYNSIPQFYSKNKNFNQKYFEGRIDEHDREISEVEINFEVGNYEYKITRGFFDADELRFYERTLKGREMDSVPDSDETVTNFDLNEMYMSSLIEDIGLSEFSQFVFTQHFVLTFDESHQLLFWDKETMERVLYLFFGVNPKDANLADELRRKFKKYTSDSGNLQWDITQTSKEIENIISMASSDSDTEDISETVLHQYQIITDELNEAIESLEKIRHSIKQIQLEIADYSLNLNTLRRQYEELFNETLETDSLIESDPKIREILKILQLTIYQDGNLEEIIKSLVKYIKTYHPLHRKSDKSELFMRLKELDDQIRLIRTKLEDSNVRESRTKKEQEDLEQIITEKKGQILKIEEENENFINSLYKETGDDITDLISRYKKQIENLKSKKEEVNLNKDKIRTELKKLEKKLKVFYQDAEEKFIPLFIEYAQSFIGLELNIRLQSYAKGTTLDLEVNDSHRKELYQLSESQRYFLDIALRMAIIEHATSKCSLMIDTPEGSLDIAYENKAGKMFADFAKRGYQLLMTANINSSELLKEIAGNCKSSGMKLERMIYWTTLSTVQVELESKIEMAYSEIEKILKS